MLTRKLIVWLLRELDLAYAMTFGPLRPEERTEFNVVRKDGDTYIVPRIPTQRHVPTREVAAQQ